MAVPDFYVILGVKKDAQVEEIRRAYRKLALRSHPDRNPGNKDAEKLFKEISEAYDVLSNADARKKYDETKFAPPPPPPNYPVSNVGVELELSAMESRDGCAKTVTVSRPRTCPICRGSGYISSYQLQRCVLCEGAGCGNCSFRGTVNTNYCATCWNTGQDRELTTIVVHVPPATAPYGRQKFVASGNLWGLRGPFYIFANVKHRVRKPGMIVR